MDYDALATQYGGTPASTPAAQNTQTTPTNGVNYDALANNYGGSSATPSTSDSGGNVLSSIGDFFFPIVGDVKNDFTGQNKKSFLQQAGDLGLSALPFIPGVGEAGEAVRGAEGAVEGAGALSKGLDAWKALSPVTQGALTGLGAGEASNLSQGGGIIPSTGGQLLNLGLGGALGAAAPAIIGKLSDTVKGVAGLTPDFENELLNTKPDELKPYIDAVQNRSANSVGSKFNPDIGFRAPTAYDVVADEQALPAVKAVTAERKAAGAAVGAAKLAVGQQPIGNITPILDNFTNEVQDRYGVSLVPDKDGNFQIVGDPTSKRQLPAGVQDRVTQIANQLQSLQGGTLRDASDIAANISDLVDYSKKDLLGNTNDPLEGLIKQTDGALRSHINDTSPIMGQANDRFIQAKNLEDDTARVFGNRMQRANLIERRVTAGNSAEAQDLFDRIKNLTGIDLTKHSVLAKWATNIAENPSEMSLFEQSVSKGKGGLTIPELIKSAGEWGLNKTIANPERISQNVMTGKGLLNRVAPYAGTIGAEGSRTLGNLLGTNQ